jgi:hypothetical protein
MNRPTRRFRNRVLPAALATGLLGLTLAACGAAGEDPSGSASPDAASTAPATSTTPQAPDVSSSTPSTTPSANASSSTPGTGEPSDTGASGVEAALRSVLGEDAQILGGDRLRELQQSSQGLTDAVKVTPAECGPEGQGAGELPEGTEMTGGIKVETTETGVVSDMLSVAVYPDAGSAAEAIEAAEQAARTCSSFTVEIGDGLSTEASLEVDEVQTQADAALGVTTTMSTSIEGASLPEGAGSSTAVTVYVQDGERLLTYSGTTAGGEPRTTGEGVGLIDDLRAELDG